MSFGSIAAAALTLALVVGPACAQSPAPAQPAAVAAQPAPPPARPSDVASTEAIVRALYEVISGDAGVERDWDRFRSLFHPAARLIPAGRNRQGVVGARSLTPEDYIATSGPYLLREGFHERELWRREERFGHIAHVFSTYDSKRKTTDPQPFARGINSIQLFHDGQRWWVLTVAWSAETPESPIPVQYLPAR
jgi:hypothetical protein